MAIIEVNHVTKEFQLGQLQSMKLGLQRMLARMSGHPQPERANLKALDDVDFKVEQGEVLGIIGHNGAGKSTLLKILSRITVPSKGTVKVRGRVAPLIEVGAGLVGELTGRENIYLNAVILGMSTREISRKFDEIVAFAELEKFVDTPLKRYSSGMAVRLGFSIATSVEADILIVDEVLAVGDIAFQRKCFDRMEDLIRRRGRTVLLVSHNIRQVERLCARTILLDHGRLEFNGPSSEACDLFVKQSNSRIREQSLAGGAVGRNVRGTGEVELVSFDLRDGSGYRANELVMGEPATIRAVFRVSARVERPEIHFGIHTTDFIYIATMGSAHVEGRPDLEPGINVVECRLRAVPLVPGTYCLRLSVLDKNPSELFYGEMLSVFTVIPADRHVAHMPALGFVDIPAQWFFGESRDQAPSHEVRSSTIGL